jgi:hypothetical protein
MTLHFLAGSVELRDILSFNRKKIKSRYAILITPMHYLLYFILFALHYLQLKDELLLFLQNILN